VSKEDQPENMKTEKLKQVKDGNEQFSASLFIGNLWSEIQMGISPYLR